MYRHSFKFVPLIKERKNTCSKKRKEKLGRKKKWKRKQKKGKKPLKTERKKSGNHRRHPLPSPIFRLRLVYQARPISLAYWKLELAIGKSERGSSRCY